MKTPGQGEQVGDFVFPLRKIPLPWVQGHLKVTGKEELSGVREGDSFVLFLSCELQLKGCLGRNPGPALQIANVRRAEGFRDTVAEGYLRLRGPGDKAPESQLPVYRGSKAPC